MNDVSIRTVATADIAAITRIYAHTVEHGTASFELQPPDEAEMKRRQQALLARNFPYIVAELAGAVVGYAYAGPYRDRRAYDWCVEDSLYIVPEFHRKGIGRLLLTRLVAESEARGFRQMIGVLVFVGLTAYDTQRIKEMYSVQDDGTVAGRKAVMGALSLYLDFINLFLMLLRIFGDRR